MSFTQRISWSVAAAALAIAVCSCAKKDSVPDEQGNYPPVFAEGRTPSCATDDDCVLACIQDGNCCDEPCQCAVVYNREQFEQVRQRHDEVCEGWPRRCDSVDCAEPAYDVEPACERGRCRARRVTPD